MPESSFQDQNPLTTIKYEEVYLPAYSNLHDAGNRLFDAAGSSTLGGSAVA
jgi:hypothetical protein